MNTKSLLELAADLVTPGGENSKLQLVFDYNCCVRGGFSFHTTVFSYSVVSLLYNIYFTWWRRDSTGTRHRQPQSDDSLLKSSVNTLNLI